MIDLKFTFMGLFANSDFGLNVGAGFQIEKISIRAQYGLGLSNLDPSGNSDMEIKNAVIGISLGYMF